MSSLISAEGICLDYPTKTIFSDVSLGLADGDRIGVVGRNGDGKSSLLKVLSQTMEPDAGTIARRNGLRVGMLGQTDSLTDEDDIVTAVVGARVAEHEWAGDPRIRGVMQGLLSDIPRDRLVGQLSGGQRRRVDLARVLVRDWDVIMLDEPTNGLDIRGIQWLADHLNHRWPRGTGALLVVTHDRWFLDEVCQNMWEVHDGVVEPFEGGYSAYILQRVERERQARVVAERRNNLMRRELAWLSRGARARSSKPKFHVEAARALIADVPPREEVVDLRRSEVSRLGNDVIELKNVSKRFGDHVVLDHADWICGRGDRIGILGENGVGKSTLLDLICGKQQPDSGRVKIGKTVKFATLSQQLTELAPFETDMVQTMLNRYKSYYVIDGKEYTPGQLLQQLGFNRKQLRSRVCELSGGQRRRLQLMLTLIDKPNVLILDEPGNDLDTDMLSAMEELLETWPAVMLLVTHDRYLMERVTSDQYALLDGKIRHCPGGVDEYLELIEKRRHERHMASREERREEKAAREQAQPAVELSRAERHELKLRFGAVQRKLEELSSLIEDRNAQMVAADPSDYQALGALAQEVEEAKAQIPALEDEWLELSEKLS